MDKRIVNWTLVCISGLLVTGTVSGQLRVVSYNAQNKPSSTSDTNWSVVLEAIGDQEMLGMSRPIDILGMQEVSVQNPANPNAPSYVAQMLNTIYNTNTYTYTRSNSGDGYNVQAYVYNTATVQLESVVDVPTLTRPAYRAKWAPVGYSEEASKFYTYNVHLKAFPDHTGTRELEAAYIRRNASTLPEDAQIIYMGDFNFTETPDGEPGYDRMLDESWQPSRPWGYDGKGQAVDPLGGAYGSTTIDTYPSRGAPANRLDYQFVSTEVSDDEGFDLIDGTYRAFNYVQLTPFRGYFDPPELSSASDHLPVVADYQVPALQSSWVDGEPTEAVLVGASVSVDVHLENVAPTFEDPDVDSDYEAAADDLDYEISGTAVSGGPITGSDVVGGGASVESVSLDTSTAGDQSGTIEIASDDEGQRDAQTGALLAQQTHNISYTVLDHANGSFDEVSDVDSVQIDLGLVAVGTGDVDELFAVWNLESMVGYTAELVISSPTALSGDTTELSLLDGSGTASAGGSVPQTARLSTSTAGVFQSLWEIEVSDEPLAGASTGTLEVELVGTVWVPGDFDLDLDVDVNDLLTWQGGYGTSDGATHSDGDADGDGDVDVNDLLMWQGNYSPGGSGGQPTPEPATLGVLALGGMALLRKKR